MGRKVSGMIDIARLRPIVEPLLNEENTASVLEAIAAIDEQDFIPRAELERENMRYHTERMKNIVWGKEKAPETPSDKSEDKEDKKPHTYEELFKIS